jgi:tetratricopeptide (TPR) repeat protein
MTNISKAIYQNRGSTQHFLFSKTDAGRVRDVKRKKAVGVNEVLRSVFPDLLFGRDFIDHAMKQLELVPKFAALVVGVDQTRQEDDKYSNPGAHDEHVDVASIIATTCQEEKGMWGALEPGLFGSFFPGKNESEGLDTARHIQKQLAEKSKQTITIGIASYPIITFEKYDMIDNARKALDHAAFFGPGSAVTFDGVSLNISGDKLYEEGDLQGAIDEFKRALLIDPSNVNVHNSLGVCYGLLGDFEPAIKEFQTVVSMVPKEHMALFNLGLVYALRKEPEEALRFFLRAEKINDSVYEIAFQSGKLYFESGDLAKAKPFLERAAKLDPDSGGVYRYLGDCYAADNLQQDAISAYKKAIRYNPQDAASISALACLFDDQGENPEITLMFCRESVGISPENGLFRYRLGRLYSKLNRFEDALKEYKKAEQYGYDAGRDIKEIKNRLAAKSS